ncbi:hypothetical protein BGW38_006309 [Lunasporangiospora selenospora]|uniref:DUF788-domain-containing protein n=1 Tax=Lunasporangiospora selenospora TaxID=979761 RepID=A0A9P6KAT9_9FUNG|nr:hypothetical protein BGW38_006309 [Lunasporangiospora selenospora]
MANTSQKKIAHQNAKALLSLRKGFIWVNASINQNHFPLCQNAFYIFYRIVYHFDTFGWKVALGYLITAGLSIFMYMQINAMGRPRYNANGELADAGQDLSQEGLVQYFFDIIYVTWFVHVTSALWSKMWWFYLSIPAYAFWKAWHLAIKPMMSRGGMGGAGASPDQAGPAEGGKSKRREKMEKRAEKGPTVRYR